MVNLEAEDRKQLITLLKDIPELTTERSRQQILELADLKQLSPMIDLSGAPFVAVNEIVSYLSNYGRLNYDQEALGRFLNTLKDFVGVQQQQFLDKLLTKYDMMTPIAPLPAINHWRGRETLVEIFEKIIGENGVSSFPGSQAFEFTLVTINSQGQEIESHQEQAYYLTEELGNGIVLEMVYIPGGEFWMGSPEAEGKKRRYSNERPQHLVTVKPFFISKYAITQTQWKQIASLPEVRQKLKLRPSRQGGNSHPVTQVSWFDAVEFCDRLSQKTGHKYRLPSEAEWEYACRAGTTTPFHFGQTINFNVANYDSRYPYLSEPKGIYREKTTEVGFFQFANSFGLFDMHGLVWEWCLDNWHQSYDLAPTNGDAWLDSNDNNIRVMRGGSWSSEAFLCRSSFRQFN
ncbi:SUMF1/EgtB/PvdO family nonheme iron enzyme [Nostoc sp. MS1]|uniref:SUMF1/EgtB/PvdO family nonheme iron enzyme n=1 Tax=Nostoc sp. MS1 TaxID=2764711 RepID=UPI001CC647A7|nr:SUMF1/EgtB/PvdO family nonheme iron enzyme [Nostoc sp. MS1]BCL35628.1 hypothetical protein NSMS1_20750 [Nostoc sp. MS1]